MSAAAAKPVEDGLEPAPPARVAKRKKLLVLAAAALLVVAAGGGGATWFVKKRAAAAAAQAEDADTDGEGAAPVAVARKDAHRGPPSFLPLDPFVVNLADADSSRYAQVGITLELNDAKSAEELKAYMPAIRNGVLMVLAHKTSAELLSRAGKEKLAGEVMREAVRPLGVDDKTPADESLVRQVHFSSFIIQ